MWHLSSLFLSEQIFSGRKSKQNNKNLFWWHFKTIRFKCDSSSFQMSFRIWLPHRLQRNHFVNKLLKIPTEQTLTQLFLCYLSIFSADMTQRNVWVRTKRGEKKRRSRDLFLLNRMRLALLWITAPIGISEPNVHVIFSSVDANIQIHSQ